jgi:hypothetical protein
MKKKQIMKNTKDVLYPILFFENYDVWKMRAFDY